MSKKINVVVWNEFRHEKKHEAVRKVYPDGLHTAIARGLARNADFSVGTATLDEPEHGLPEKRLAGTDVLIWWGHMAHNDVQDAIAQRVHKHVLNGMGLIVLHSGHFSKPFRLLMGTTCSLKWREADEKERLWVTERSHPIAEGLGEYFELPMEEMYGERFDIPTPDELVFISWFPGGEVFRSGCCWRRGYGRVFYFRPGHESYPTYHNPVVIGVMANACRWAARRMSLDAGACPNVKPLEPLPARKK